MYSITYRGKAADEYSAAIKWYEERSLQVAENFMDAVNERLDALSDHPAKYKKSLQKIPRSKDTKIYIYDRILHSRRAATSHHCSHISQ